jgi:signal transduction histidine kinase
VTKLTLLFRSLRFRITAAATLVIVAVLALTGVVLINQVQHHLLQQVDNGLLRDANYYRPMLPRHAHLPRVSTTDQLGEILAADGTILSKSSRLIGMPPLVSVLPSSDRPTLTTVYNPQFGHLRILEQRVGDPAGRIFVDAQQINEIPATRQALTQLLLISLPLLATALAVLVWMVLGRAMNRVDSIRAAVADITDRNLQERLPTTPAGDEIARLVNTMNQMLARLETALSRERRFVADASHELRTPVAALHAALELPRHGREGLQRSQDAAIRALQRLDVLVEGLLVLDSSADPARANKTPIDVDDVVLDVVEHVRALTTKQLDVSNVSGGQVLAREVDIIRIVENLTSNAVRHATSRVTFTVCEQEKLVRLTVEDDGPGIPEDSRVRVFERFARISDDRSRTEGGSGLGLAIVAELVKENDGRVWAEDVQPQGARFVVDLPALFALSAETLNEPEQERGNRPHPLATSVST